MPDPALLETEIQKQMDSLKTALGPVDYPAFEKSYNELVQQARDPAKADEIFKQLHALVISKPKAAEVLHQAAPNLFSPTGDVPSPEEPRPPKPAPVAPAQPAPQPDKPPGEAPVAPPDHPAPAKTDTIGQKQWTADVVIQFFKEIVTAIIGLALIGFTLYTASGAFTQIGTPKLSDAKDLLQLMLGLAGVVIGYYFGRVPADARATQAQQQATNATDRTTLMGAKAEQLRSVADKIEQATKPPTRGGTGTVDENTAGEIQRLREGLQSLSDLARVP